MVKEQRERGTIPRVEHIVIATGLIILLVSAVLSVSPHYPTVTKEYYQGIASVPAGQQTVANIIVDVVGDDTFMLVVRGVNGSCWVNLFLEASWGRRVRFFHYYVEPGKELRLNMTVEDIFQIVGEPPSPKVVGTVWLIIGRTRRYVLMEYVAGQVKLHEIRASIKRTIWRYEPIIVREEVTAPWFEKLVIWLFVAGIMTVTIGVTIWVSRSEARGRGSAT